MLNNSIEDTNELAQDILDAMLRQEESYKCADYFAASRKRNKEQQKLISRENRKEMIQWCYKVAYVCQFSRETVTQAIALVDRYLCSNRQANAALYDRMTFQLVFMTAFFIANKLNESIALDLDCLVHLSGDQFSESDFVKQEAQILMALKWKINGPTPLAFIDCLCQGFMHTSQFETIEDVRLQAHYQVDLALCEADFICIPSSEMAIAAILNALSEIDNTEASMLMAMIRINFVRNESNISKVQKKLCDIVQKTAEQAISSSSKEVKCDVSDGETQCKNAIRKAGHASQPRSPISVAKREGSARCA